MGVNELGHTSLEEDAWEWARALIEDRRTVRVPAGDAQVAVTYRPSWYTLAVEEEWRRPPRASGRRGRW